MTDSLPDAVRWHLAVALLRVELSELADELGLRIEPYEHGSHRVGFEVVIDRDEYEIDDTELTDAIADMLEFEDDDRGAPSSTVSHTETDDDDLGDGHTGDNDAPELEQDNLALVHELNEATRFETLSERAVEALEDLPEGQTASWFATNDIDFEGATAEEIFDELCEVRTRVGPTGVEYVDGYEPPAAQTDGDDSRGAPSSTVSHNETDDDNDDLAVDPPAMDSTVHR